MKVLVAANAVRTGGGLQHLLGVLPALAGLAPEHEWLVVTNPATADLLPALPDRWSVEARATERLGPLRRLLVEQRLLARRARSFGADVVLTFNSFAVAGLQRPQVLIASNALYICDQYWRQIPPVGLERLEARLRWLFLRRSIYRADVAVTPSEWMAQVLRERLNLRADRIQCVHYGLHPHFLGTRDVDQPIRRPSEPASAGPPHPPLRGRVGEGGGRAPHDTSAVSQPTILAVSKHGINKDFPTLVRAATLLLREGCNVQVELTGTPDESRYARKTAALIEDLGIGLTVRFIGDCSVPELARRYEASDLFVFPSWCESFGLPQMEAAAFGLPVVAPDLAVSRELLADGARYYRPLDPEHLAETIRHLLQQPEEAVELGARAAERARSFTWERAAARTLEVLESVLQGQSAVRAS